MEKLYRNRCGCCNGSGEIEHVSGEWLRWKREGAGVSLRAMARRLRFSPPYISDVELGKRFCTDKIRKAYENL